MRAAVVLTAVTALAGCTEPEPAPKEPAQFTVRGRWETPSLSYFVERENSPIGAEAFTAAVDRAARIWNETAVVALRRTDDAASADLAIGWRRGHHGACQPFGPNADVAHAGPLKRRGTFIHFDLGREWTDESVFGTALHELGHILGLGHSEAPDAVMGTDPKRPTELSWHDLAGLHSLYGDQYSLDTVPGDIWILGKDTTLRRVCPRATCRRAAFDTDGDGDEELLIWRIDTAGHGAMMAYHFTAGPKLARTLGPFPGLVAPEAEVKFIKSEAGHRYVASVFEGGKTILRQFDQHGIPGQPKVPLSAEEIVGAPALPAGDLDGDGKQDIHIHGETPPR